MAQRAQRAMWRRIGMAALLLAAGLSLWGELDALAAPLFGPGAEGADCTAVCARPVDAPAAGMRCGA